MLDVKAIRKTLGMTQRNFSKTFGIPLSTLTHWEHGTRKPDRANTILLLMISRDPISVRAAVLEYLGMEEPIKPVATETPAIVDENRELLNIIITDHFGIPNPEKYDDTASWIDDLGADSLDCIEMIMAIEEVFEIEIGLDEVEADKIKTIADVLSMIKKKQSEK